MTEKIWMPVSSPIISVRCFSRCSDISWFLQYSTNHSTMISIKFKVKLLMPLDRMYTFWNPKLRASNSDTKYETIFYIWLLKWSSLINMWRKYTFSNTKWLSKRVDTEPRFSFQYIISIRSPNITYLLRKMYTLGAYSLFLVIHSWSSAQHSWAEYLSLIP